MTEIKVIENLPGVPEKGDMSDLVTKGWKKENFSQLFAGARPLNEIMASDLFSGGKCELIENRRLNLLALTSVPINRTEWFDKPYIPFDEFTSADGDGGIGKSTAYLDIGACYTKGKKLPGGMQHEPGNFLILAEEDRDDLIRARLRVAGADENRVHLIKSFGEKENHVVFPDHAFALEAVIDQTGAKFVLIDSIFNHYAPDLKRGNPNDDRRVFNSLVQVAHTTGAAIVGIRHWGKSPGRASARAYGSAEIRNVARSAITIGVHPEDENLRVFAVSKSNLGPPCEALIYRLEIVEMPDDNGLPFEVPRVVWEGSQAISADRLTLAEPDGEDARLATEDAEDIILEALAAGRTKADDLQKAVLAKGVADITFRRARGRLRTRKKIIRGGGGVAGSVWWELVIEPATDSHD